MPDNPRDRKDGGMNVFARYLGLAMLLPSGSMVGYGVGYALDLWLHTHILKIVCALLGTAGGFMAFIRELTRS